MTEGPYHHGNLRTALLERAETVLTESGVEGLSLRALARDLGVSHAAPSRHFRDRQALLDALAVSGFTRLNTRLSAAAEAPGPVPDRLAALGRAYVDFAVTHAPLLNLMFSAKRADDSSAELRELGHHSLDTTAGLIAQAQAEGFVREGDPARLAQVAFSTVHGLATLALGSLLDDTPLPEATDLALDVLLTGLARPGR
ncbi:MULTISPECIES: TetR/AcrR family transcriptional regulator [Streptomyces]|uniref:TetR/AcrR family transcriptional regulator n=1 Tax=Streptomyces katrae TaxID=68223 RepID=A0ABT7GV32_9ACTN|nr:MULTISPECIES: TetR/AcrR family transcriptional regulator [Streptomyces]MDK9497091.1 TetR/AcrR family transcriptional regulator [Streptomyces katrae]RSS99070.1 TetR/AcrR family transcriptional regulator [Streptomyces sp. WAC07149]GLX24035.1 TetR family transcriptional regulator [Streptomyces lavendulae subsp. lavendulae]GLX31892.1 TetR family transcriptional regulator [Streptomyces lavendulae subsp. lavendulae]